MSDTSGKVLRGGCLGCAIGGVAAAFLGGVLAALLSLAQGPDPLLGDLTGLAVVTLAGIGFFPGAIIGALVGASRAASSPSVSHGGSSELELARLKKRVAELEDKARQEAIHKASQEAIQRKKGS
jgi:hypothetical protein